MIFFVVFPCIVNDTAIEKHIKQFETFFFNHENNTIKRLEIYMFRTCNPEHALKMYDLQLERANRGRFCIFWCFQTKPNLNLWHSYMSKCDWFWLSLKTLKIRKSGFGLLVQRL
jgi:hypothetical protein